MKQPTPITLLINITPRHIERGKRFSCRRCPIALGIQDALPRPTPPEVGSLTIHVDGYRPIPTPMVAGLFIGVFDRIGAHAVAPISFELTLS